MKSTSLVVLLYLAALFAMTNATETFRRLDQESSIGKKSKRDKSESISSDSGKSKDESEEYMSMHIMSLHHQSMSFELSMSYPPTGKGSKGSKSKGKKNSKSGKSKGSKSGKKSSKKGESGKGKGGGSDHPMPAPSSDECKSKFRNCGNENTKIRLISNFLFEIYISASTDTSVLSFGSFGDASVGCRLASCRTFKIWHHVHAWRKLDAHARGLLGS